VTETQVQIRIVAWIKTEPLLRGVLFLAPSNECKNTSFEAKGGKRGASDLLFFEERGGYKGLANEIKIVPAYKADGTCKFPEQEKFLSDLRLRGWKAEFTVGYEETKKLISEYFEL
jgi:hypothetical protein